MPRTHRGRISFLADFTDEINGDVHQRKLRPDRISSLVDPLRYVGIERSLLEDMIQHCLVVGFYLRRLAGFDTHTDIVRQFERRINAERG